MMLGTLPWAVQKGFVQQCAPMAACFSCVIQPCVCVWWLLGRQRAQEKRWGPVYSGRYLASTSACSIPLPGSSRAMGQAGMVGTCSPSLSRTWVGADCGSPWVSDHRARQSPRALPASNYQDKAFHNNGYCRIAYSPRGFYPKPNEVSGKTPIDFNRVYIRLLACWWWLCL